MDNSNLVGGGAQRSYGATNDNVPSVAFSSSSHAELRSRGESITTNIYTINSSLKQLDDALKMLGTQRDSRGLRDKIHVTQLSSNQIISQTTKDLQNLTTLAKGKEKPFKLQVEALTSRFKEAVNLYSSKQKQVLEKMKFCMLPSEVAQQEDEANDPMSQSEERLRQQHEQRQDLEFSNGLQIEQLQQIRHMESDILDVNEIMRKLAALVVEQGQSVNSIENLVDDTHQQVESGKKEVEIADAYMYKRRKRTLFMCTFAIGIVLVFGVLVYFTLR